jgi:GxxExxY protein
LLKNERLTSQILACAFEVHKNLGPGLLESAYRRCLEYELTAAKLSCKSELELPVLYKGVNIQCGYRIDLLIEDTVVLELKSVDALSAVHEAQILTYMRLANKDTGLLINFNCKMLKNGIRRFVL